MGAARCVYCPISLNVCRFVILATWLVVAVVKFATKALSIPPLAGFMWSVFCRMWHHEARIRELSVLTRL